MSSRFFKVQYGYGANEYIPIDETELKRAIYAHLTGKKVALENGSVSGDKIIVIAPDWNKAMGWNAGYKPTPEELGEVENEVGKLYQGVIAEAKSEVSAYIQNGELEKLNAPTNYQLRTNTQGFKQIGEIK